MLFKINIPRGRKARRAILKPSGFPVQSTEISKYLSVTLSAKPVLIPFAAKFTNLSLCLPTTNNSQPVKAKVWAINCPSLPSPTTNTRSSLHIYICC